VQGHKSFPGPLSWYKAALSYLRNHASSLNFAQRFRSSAAKKMILVIPFADFNLLMLMGKQQGLKCATQQAMPQR